MPMFIVRLSGTSPCSGQRIQSIQVAFFSDRW